MGMSRVVYNVLKKRNLSVYPAGISRIRFEGGAGYGGTNTRIRYFSSVTENVPPDFGIGNDSTNGAVIVINNPGIYTFTYTEQFAAVANYGLSRNSTQLTTSIVAITRADVLVRSQTASADRFDSVSWTGYLTTGDAIRPHADGNATGSDALAAILYGIRLA
jgi:hypothetical protein